MEAIEFHMAVFNSDMTKLYAKNMSLPIEKRYVILESPVLDKNGNVFLQYKQFEKEIVNRESEWDEDR